MEIKRFFDQRQGKWQDGRSAEEGQGGLIEENQKRGDEGGADNGEGIFPPAKVGAKADDEGVFIGYAVCVFIAEVIGDENRTGEESWREAGDKDRAAEGVRLEEIGTAGGDGAEKDKDEQFAESHIAEGSGSSRIEDAKEDGERGGGEAPPTSPEHQRNGYEER